MISRFYATPAKSEPAPIDQPEWLFKEPQHTLPPLQRACSVLALCPAQVGCSKNWRNCSKKVTQGRIPHDTMHVKVTCEGRIPSRTLGRTCKEKRPLEIALKYLSIFQKHFIRTNLACCDINVSHAADKSGEDKDATSDEVDVTPSQSAAVCAALASAITWKLISEGRHIYFHSLFLFNSYLCTKSSLKGLSERLN